MNATRVLTVSLAALIGLTACARPASAEYRDPAPAAAPTRQDPSEPGGVEPLQLPVTAAPVGPRPNPVPPTVPELANPTERDPDPSRPVVVSDLELGDVVSPGVCGPQGGFPGDAQSVESIVLDVDDDGGDDEVTTYFVAHGDGAGWRLRTELDNGVVDDIAIEGVGAGVARVLGAVHAHFEIADPTTYDHELLVQVGANASGVNTAVYGLDDDGCLFRFGAAGGGELVLPVHQSIGTTSGVYCESFEGEEFLTRLEANLISGTTYAATVTRLDRVGDELHESPFGAFEIDAEGQAGWFEQFGSISCAFVF